MRILKMGYDYSNGHSACTVEHFFFISLLSRVNDISGDFEMQNSSHVVIRFEEN